MEGLSYKFNKEYWNYAKLISGVLRYGMPINQIVDLVAAMEFDNENINTWKNGVERALRNLSRMGRKQPVRFVRIAVLNPLFIKRGV